MTIKDVCYFMGLPYTVSIKRDDEGDFVARVEELEGCLAHGSTAGDALTRLSEVQEDWLTEAVAAGLHIPEPNEESLPSGKWLQRVPRTLHRKLVAAARRENVSLNQLVTSVLAEAIGAKAPPSAKPEAALCSAWDRDSGFGPAYRIVITGASVKGHSGHAYAGQFTYAKHVAQTLPKDGTFAGGSLCPAESLVFLDAKREKEEQEKTRARA